MANPKTLTSSDEKLAQARQLQMEHAGDRTNIEYQNNALALLFIQAFGDTATYKGIGTAHDYDVEKLSRLIDGSQPRAISNTLTLTLPASETEALQVMEEAGCKVEANPLAKTITIDFNDEKQHTAVGNYLLQRRADQLSAMAQSLAGNADHEERITDQFEELQYSAEILGLSARATIMKLGRDLNTAFAKPDAGRSQ